MLDTIEELTWLLAWFHPRGLGITYTDTTNYFYAGLIDSLGVIKLITEVEEHFEIRFQQSDFQDRRFATIRGLAEIVAERKSDE